MADKSRAEDAADATRGSPPFEAPNELARTMIGTAPGFADTGEHAHTSILPAIDRDFEARELVRAAQRELEAADGDRAAQARLHHSLALVFEDRLDDPHSALLHYERAHDLEPGDLTYLRAARRCYRGRQNWTMTLALLEGELERVAEPAAVAQLLLEQGQIYEEWLANAAVARECYERALAVDVGNREVLHRLRRLLDRVGDRRAQLEICRQAIAATTDRRQRSHLYTEVAAIQLEVLKDEGQAIESYAVAFVEDPHNVTASVALQRLYARRGRWGDVVDILLTTGDLAESDRQRQSKYLAAARLCRDRLQQSERALELLERVQQQDSEPLLLSEMAELLHAAGRYEDLAAVYAQQVTQAGPDAALAHYRLASLLERHLGRTDEALTHYEAARSAEPSFEPARHALLRLYRARHAFEEVVELGRDELRSLRDARQQATALVHLAQIVEQQLGDPERAIALNHQALATAPGFAPAQRELADLYRRTGASRALLELLEQQVDGVNAETPVVLLELGLLAEHGLADLPRAARYYGTALERSPRDPWLLQALGRVQAARGEHAERLALLDREAARSQDGEHVGYLRRTAAGLCEGLLQQEDEALRRYEELREADPSDRLVVAALARIYEQRGAWERLADLYRAQLDDSAGPKTAAALHCRLGELYEGPLERLDEAVDHLQHALQLDVECRPALHGLARLYRQQGAWDDLYEVQRKLAELASEPRHRAGFLHAAGELCEHRRDSRDEALVCYRQALEAMPEHEGAREAALALLDVDGRHAEAVELLEGGLRHAFERRRRLGLLKRLGLLLERELGATAQALATVEQGLSLDASDLELLELLGQLYRRQHDYEGVVTNLERLAASCEDVQERVRYLREAAFLAEVHLAGERNPMLLYQAILEHAPADRRAQAALARIHLRLHNHDALISICRAQLTGENSQPRRVELLQRLAAAQEAAGGLAAAGESLAAAVELAEHWLVVRELRRVREELGHWREVAAALEIEAKVSRHEGHVAASLMAAAELYQERFDEPERAIAALRRVLEHMPFHEQAASRLEQLLVQREGWQELVDVARGRLEAAARGARPEGGSALQARIELLVRMAWIQREHLQKPAEAVATLKRAMQLDPHHVSTLLTLSELLVSLEQWAEAVEVLERVVVLSDDPDLLLRAHFQLGELFAQEVDDPRGAISSFQNVLAIAPKDRDALRRLYQLFRRTGDWDNAAEIITRLLELERDAERQVEHYIALAEIAEHGQGDAEQAADRYYEALAIAPANEQVVDRLTALLSQLGRWERLCDSLRSHLAALSEEMQTRAIARRMQLAEVLHRHLARTNEALEQYRAVVEIDPTDTAARLASARILGEQGRFDEAVAQHREVLEIEPLHRDSLVQLRALWSRAGSPEMAYAAAAVLVCTGLAEEPERRLYREHRTVGVRAPQLPIEPVLYASTLLHPAEHHPGRAILNVLCEVAHRVRPPDFERWQIGKGDRLSPRSEDPLKLLVQQVRTCLGLVRDVEIYISHVRSREIDLLLSDPPALVVGGGVMASFSSRQVRFWVARLLSYVRNRTWIGYGLDGRQLGTLVVATRRLVDPQAAATGLDEAELLEMSRLIQRSLSRRGRRALDETVRGLREGRTPGYAEWALGMQLTALRTALWAVNDLETAIDHLRQIDPQLAQVTTPEQLGQALRNHRLAAEVLRFWLSDDLLTAKRSTDLL